MHPWFPLTADVEDSLSSGEGVVADLVLVLHAVEGAEGAALEGAVLGQLRWRCGGDRRRRLDTLVTLVVGTLFDTVAPLVLLQTGAARGTDSGSCRHPAHPAGSVVT